MSPCLDWKKKKCKIKACDSFAQKPFCAAVPYCNWSGKKNGKCIETVHVESDTDDACEALKEELGEQTARRSGGREDCCFGKICRRDGGEG